MIRSGFALLGLLLMLAACAQAPALPSTSEATATVIPVTVELSPTPTLITPATATQHIDGNLFSKISYSTAVLHTKCDPLEIIFSVTVKEPTVKGVLFFFRMKDKPTGIASGWSNGENMRPAGNGIFEFIFRASAIPSEARYKDAWVQYQFAGVGQAGQNMGQSQIFSEEVTFTPACP